MKLPSKVTPFKESIIAKFTPVLDKLKSGPYRHPNYINQ